MANEVGYYSGHLDVELVPKGVEQAELAGEALKDEAFDLVISSDLKRALETARVILRQQHKNNAAASNQLSIETDILLRERSYGVMEGKNKGDFLKKALELGFKDVDPKNPSRCVSAFLSIEFFTF